MPDITLNCWCARAGMCCHLDNRRPTWAERLLRVPEVASQPCEPEICELRYPMFDEVLKKPNFPPISMTINGEIYFKPPE